LYRFIPFDGIEALDDILNKLDEFPQGETAEDTIRQLIHSDYGSQYSLEGVRGSIEYILDAVRADPEIEGILGFSEGAVAAASAILEEKRLWEEEGIPRQLKVSNIVCGYGESRRKKKKKYQTKQSLLSAESSSPAGHHSHSKAANATSCSQTKVKTPLTSPPATLSAATIPTLTAQCLYTACAIRTRPIYSTMETDTLFLAKHKH